MLMGISFRQNLRHLITYTTVRMINVIMMLYMLHSVFHTA